MNDLDGGFMLSNETRPLDGGYIVQRYKILGTDIHVHAVWERYSNHSTMTTINGEWYGRIGTRRLPAFMEALPAMSDERSRIVGEWHDAQYAQAYEMILRAFPELIPTRQSMGEIETYEPQWEQAGSVYCLGKIGA
jgi:hypothetical protein